MVTIISLYSPDRGSPMSDDAPEPAKPTRRRRGHNEGSVYQRASDGLWVADASLGYGSDGNGDHR